MKVVVIKYHAGNVQSVLFALERIGVQATLSDNPQEIITADKIIFPGVGEASSAMNYLKERQLDSLLSLLKQPVLGICLGMQLMCEYSEEGNTKCLSIFNQQVKRFTGGGLKVPQTGWNTIYDLKSSLFKGVRENEYMYFVHSYYAEFGETTIATTDYGAQFSAALQKDNFFATQFHPEKSGDAGQKILENFIYGNNSCH